MLTRPLSRDSLYVPILLLYLVSFALPTYEAPATTISPGFMSGYEAFLWGVLALVALYPVWVANVFFWAGMKMLATKGWGAAAGSGVVALLLALVPLWHDTNGGKGHLLIGYFVWLGCMVLLTLAGLIGLLPRGEHRTADAADEPSGDGERWQDVRDTSGNDV